jgi:putative flippase GtrA
VEAVAQQVKKWLAEPVQSWFVQVPRALLASLLAAAVDIGVLFFLVEIAGSHPLSAAIVGYLAGGVLQYLLCYLWIFPGTNQLAATGFLAFTVLSLVGLGITWLTMATLADLAHIHYSLAKVVALGLAFTWNFLSRKYLIFGPALESQPTSPIPARRKLFTLVK